MGKSLNFVSQADKMEIYGSLCKDNPALEIYRSNNIDIMITRAPVEVCSNEHDHEGYEFFIPFSLSPITATLTTGSKSNISRALALFPINPDQGNRLKEEFTPCSSQRLYIRKNYLQHIAHAVCGVREVVFDCQANPCSKKLKRLIRLFVSEAREQQSGYRYVLDSISTQIVIELLRSTGNNTRSRMNCRETGATESILRAIDYLNDHYNKNFSNTELLSITNLSPYYSIRLFKKETGKTPHEYLLHLKIEKAKELLTFSSYSITEICFLCGFSEHSHFSKVFRKITGTSPIAYRKAVKNST